MEKQEKELPGVPWRVLARRPIKMHADWCVVDHLYPQMLRMVNFPYTYFNDEELASLIVVDHPRNDAEAVEIIKQAIATATAPSGAVSDRVPVFENGDSVRVMQTPAMERLGWDGVTGFVLVNWMNGEHQICRVQPIGEGAPINVSATCLMKR